MQSLNRSLLSLVVLACLTAAPTPASGQSTLDQWKGINVSGLQTVFVRDTAGVETTGKLLALSPDSLTMLVDGVERQFDARRVGRIQTRDSLKNGTIAGAIVGVAMGILSGGLADCSFQRGNDGCAGFRVAMLALSTGVYTGLGAGIDAMIQGRTTLYAATPGSASSFRAKSPSPSPAAMLHVGVSW